MIAWSCFLERTCYTIMQNCIGDLYIVIKPIKSKWTPELDLLPDDVLVFVKKTKWDNEYLFFYVPRLNQERPYHKMYIESCMKKID